MARPKLTDEENHSANLRTTQVIGAAMLAPGLLISAICLYTLTTVLSFRLMLCGAVIGLPLLVSGARRLLSPASYQSDAHRDLD